MSSTPIQNMDAKAARDLSSATMAALVSVAEQFGVTVKVTGGKYDPVAGTFSPKVTFTEAGGAEREWRQDAHLFDLEADDWHAEFEAQGRRFRIVGMNLRARRMPIQCEEISTGRTFRFPAEGVQRALRTERGRSHE